MNLEVNTQLPGFRVTEVRRYESKSEPGKSATHYRLQCDDCGHERYWRRFAIEQHANGLTPLKCTGCAPQKPRSKGAGRVAGFVERRAPVKLCAWCYGMGAESRTPPLKCGCAMPQEARVA